MNPRRFDSLTEQENQRYCELNLHNHADVGVFMSPSYFTIHGKDRAM